MYLICIIYAKICPIARYLKVKVKERNLQKNSVQTGFGPFRWPLARPTCVYQSFYWAYLAEIRREIDQDTCQSSITFPFATRAGRIIWRCYSGTFPALSTASDAVHQMFKTVLVFRLGQNSTRNRLRYIYKLNDDSLSRQSSTNHPQMPLDKVSGETENLWHGTSWVYQ